VLPLLDRHSVQLWLPEIGGPIDRADPRPVSTPAAHR
jgi:hypothetical protein